MDKSPRIARWDIDNFIIRLTAMRHEAHAIGMHATGHALHDAVKKSGWELAHLIERGAVGKDGPIHSGEIKNA